MKRLTATVLAVLMILSCVAVLASCNDAGTATETEKQTESATESVTESVTESESETEHTHEYEETERVEPTCTESGCHAFTCKTCGDIHCEELAALGHDYQKTEEVPATCAEDAYAVYTCSRCGDSYRETDEGTATGIHTYGDEPEYAKDDDGNVCTVCAVCGHLNPLTKDEVIAAIYAGMPEFKQEVIAYCCPNGDDAENYEKIFTLMMEAGITATVSGGQGYGSGGQIAEMLDVCEQIGFGVYIDMFGQEAGAMVSKLWFAEGYECVRGVYLKDEPFVNMFENLGEATRRIREEVEGADKWLMGANMFPYGTSAYAEGDHGYGYVSHGWYNTLLEYVEIVDPGFISFDRYPWWSHGELGGTPNYYTANLLVAKKVADLSDLPLFTFIQTTGVGGVHAPTEEQIRCEINLSLACGADALLLFTVYGGYGFEGIIFNHGDHVNVTYFALQTVLEEINAMKGIYDLFDFEKVITHNCNSYDQAITEFEVGEYLADSYGRLVSVSSDGQCFIGCMKDDEGREGFYVVNNNYRPEDPDSFTLTFTEETTYQIWGKNGLSDIGTADSLTLNLMPGEGQFIVLGGDNLPN